MLCKSLKYKLMKYYMVYNYKLKLNNLFKLTLFFIDGYLFFNSS